MAVFTYDTGRLMDVDIGDDHYWLVSVEHEGSETPHCYSVASDSEQDFGSGRSSLSELLDRIGQRVWLKYRVRKVWNEDGTSRTERVLVDVDDIGDVMDAKSRFWEWSLLPTVGVFALIITMVLAFSGLGPVAPASAETRTATLVYANADIDGNTEIVQMEYPDGAIQNVSDNESTDQDPALSPDGSKVAFVSNRDAQVDNVWVMDADGGNARSVSFLSVIPSAQSNSPAWSPDGQVIAFSSTRYGTTDIWMASADGMNTWSVTWDSKVDSAPAFSADGSRLFFSSDGRLVSVAVDGSDRQELTDPGSTDALADNDPATAPNGTHVAFWRYSYHTGSHLMVMRTDGSELRELDTGEGVAREPAWLPDSTGLVFSSDRDRSTRGSGARTDLYAYNLSNDQITRLTRSGKDLGKPSIGQAEVEVVQPGGSGVQSETPPTSAFYFAEGTVRPGFVQYFTIQNPGNEVATVTIAYQASTDAGAPIALPSQQITIPAGTRSTVNVNHYFSASGVSSPANVSAAISSNVPVVSERPMYYSADPGLGTTVDGGTVVVGKAG